MTILKTVANGFSEEEIRKQNETAVTSKDVTTEKDYWNSFYSRWTIDVPSQFCVLAATEVNKDTPIVEFGCGNGRDSIYLSKQGFRVCASDLSSEGIAKNNAKVESFSGPLNEHKLQISFSICNCTDKKQVSDLISGARVDGGNITVYHRFFLHSIDASQEKQFFEALEGAMISGDRILMEFRCSLDEALPKFYGKDHYRRYVHTPDFVEYLDSIGFQVEYEQTGQGMAKYKNEDPFVSRVIAKLR